MSRIFCSVTEPPFNSLAVKIPVPDGWFTHIHPKGWRYYTNPSRKLVTDFKIETLDGQNQLRATLGEDDVVESDQLPARCELWVNEGANPEKPERMYVDHQERTISVVPPRRGDFLRPARRWTSDGNKRSTELRFEQNYFYFLRDHPCHTSLPEFAEEDALAELSRFCHDRLLHAEESVVPYSKEMSRELLSLLQSMVDNLIFASPRCEPVKVHLVSDILEVSGERLSQHYGLQDARKYLNEKLHARAPKDVPPPLVVRLFWTFSMAILCFGAPFAYLRYIDEMFMTGFGRTDTTTERWHRFVRENVKDWNGTNLVATVLISATVAFLAIPGIDSVSRCLGLVSVLLAMASIITGLLNVWQHQHETRATPELTIIMDFFQQAERGVHSFNLLAVLLSLPLVLLIWSTITFAVGIVTFAWRGVDTTILDAAGGDSQVPDLKMFAFGMPTAWVTTGVLLSVVLAVLASFFFFWRVNDFLFSSYMALSRRYRCGLHPMICRDLDDRHHNSCSL
ncbi:hypothetical protein K439DRAFT_1351098 [Ramaria rubella]|nr:hypothetical protein K439DRAFT_1351098 [Ramaria rubella]